MTSGPERFPRWYKTGSILGHLIAFVMVALIFIMVMWLAGIAVYLITVGGLALLGALQ